MRRFLPFGLVLLYLLGLPGLAPAAEHELLQPVESRSDLILESTRGQARVLRGGGAAQRVSLRSNERLTTIEETQGGWTAAGVSEEEDGSKLIVFTRSPAGTRRMAAPSLQRHPLQLRPALVVQDEQLDGLAWLEGSNPASLSVRVAARAGEDWGEVIIVAPPAKGSQTGLVQTVLADGSWLLAWSAFDGRDDEILWSIGRNDNWSVPSRIGKANSVPDVLPALVSTPDGALLVWSRQIEGHYRLLLSRYQSNSWSRPQIVGPPGSLDPGFAIREGQLLLLYRHAWPRGWAITELSTKGIPRRLAVVSDDNASRPALLHSSSEGIELRWVGQRRALADWEAVP